MSHTTANTTTPTAMSLRHRFSLKRFFAGEGPEPGPIFLAQRRVYILPSRMGVYFAAMMLIMLLGAVNYNNSLAYALTFLLASIFFIAILHTYRNLLHLRVDVGQIPAVFCGEIAQVPIMLDNRRSAARYAIKLQLRNQQHTNVDITGDQWQRNKVPLRTTHRGRHTVPRLTLETGFPLGLFRAWAYAQRDVCYFVYPIPDQHHPLPDESSYHLDLQGDRGHGTDDFAGLRNYHAGDSLRHIHWKTVARGQDMFTKQFGGDQAIELWLDWDSLPNLDTEARLSRLTRWVLDASATQVNYGLRLPNTHIPPGTGSAHQQQCLQALALHDITPDADISSS
ncbi:MAG: DUF58 domain-containing protein [Gammaproteobacteria bacterium]|nr:DUF58 domain-containing protein [Gammaproteobacteria bacterium]